MRAYDAEELLHRFGNIVYRLALVQMKNTSDAQDIVQETFLQLVKKKPAFESGEHAKAWLIRVALNRCHSLHRSSWWKTTVQLSEEVPQPEQPESSGLLAEVQALPEKYRAAVHLYYYEDLPLQDIAQILNISYSAAAQRLSRARGLLKNALEGAADYDEFQRTIPG